MTGQNTEKQILAMVILLVLSVASLGAYTWFDNGRRTEAISEVYERDAERGAHIFARNCRVCHGNDGRGSESSSSLVGPALNKPGNTYAWRTDNAGQLLTLQNQYRYTIACGRNGTPMPPWSLDQGGSLDDFKIDNLVTLITTNAGDAWHVAIEAGVHEDEVNIENLYIALDAATETMNASGFFPSARDAEDAVRVFEARDNKLNDLRAAVAEAEESGEGLEDAQAALADYEKEYGDLVLAVVTVRTSSSLSERNQAQTLLNSASRVQRDVAEKRAWLKIAGEFETAVANVEDAETRFAEGLPIDQPPAQVTASTCGQVHDFSQFDLSDIPQRSTGQVGTNLGTWLTTLPEGDDS